MFADVTRDRRAPCVLLGGSGQRKACKPQGRRVPALFRPLAGVAAQAAVPSQSATALAGS